MRTAIVVLLLIWCLPSFASENSQHVRAFIVASNERNIDAMLELAATDMRWMSISGEQLSTETSSHEELRAAMTGYFESTQGTRSELITLSASGPFVHTVERAFWMSSGVERSQCSMALYELVSGKIQNVWYFPAYVCE